MSEAINESLIANRLRAEARIEALGWDDPSMRFHALHTLVAEGEVAVAPFAVEALRELPEGTQDDSTTPALKANAGLQLVQALGEHGQFAEADTVIPILDALDEETAMTARISLLQKGYTGPDGEYTRLDFTEELEEAEEEGVPPMVVHSYLVGIAANGIDMFDVHAGQSKLLLDVVAATADPRDRDSLYSDIAQSYAHRGEYGRALTATDLISGLYLANLSAIRVAEAALDNDNTSLADELIAKVRGNLLDIWGCTGACGDSSCEGPKDARLLEIHLAELVARRQATAEALELVGTLDPEEAIRQAAVWGEVYRITGNAEPRANAVRALSAVPQANSYGDIHVIGLLGEGDREWGNVVSVPVSEGKRPLKEEVPLICWQIGDICKRRLDNELERQDISLDPDTPQRHDPDIEEIVDALVKTNRGARDGMFVRAASLLASSGAPRTAMNLIGLIDDSSYKIAAKIAVARRLSERHNMRIADEAVGLVGRTNRDMPTSSIREVTVVAEHYMNLLEEVRQDFGEAADAIQLLGRAAAILEGAGPEAASTQASLQEAMQHITKLHDTLLFARDSLRRYFGEVSGD